MGRISASLAGVVLQNCGGEWETGPLGSEEEAERLKEPICLTGRSVLWFPRECLVDLGAGT